MTSNAVERTSRIFTLPNALSLVRLCFIPLILMAMLQGHMSWALLLFVAAGITDFADGTLARWLNQRSVFGMYLDPVADKLLLSSSFLVLAFAGQIPWVVTGIVLARDAAIIGAVLVLLITTDIRLFPPTALGKANTAVQVAAVFVVLLDAVYGGIVLERLRQVLLVATPMLVVASGLQYAWVTLRKLRSARAKSE